jgi:hypothetical protein
LGLTVWADVDCRPRVVGRTEPEHASPRGRVERFVVPVIQVEAVLWLPGRKEIPVCGLSAPNNCATTLLMRRWGELSRGRLDVRLLVDVDGAVCIWLVKS